jgi:hypothetical protein
VSDLATRIAALPSADAVRVLNAVTKARVARGAATALTPDAALGTALTSETGAAPEAGVSDGDVAKAALALLAEDPAVAPTLAAMIENPPAEDSAHESVALGMGIGVAALVVLQSYIKFERDKAGEWTFKFEKQPMSDSLLKDLIGKLGGWLGGS